MGTPEMAVAPLAALVEAGHDVRLVVSRPDKRRGRGGATTPSPVKAEALRLGLRVTDNLDDVLDEEADLGVVVAYGRIIPTRILEALPMLNIHFSLLPRWRGAAPVERAILSGDHETGVCLMGVAPELDSGPVYATARLTIDEDETLTDLRARLVSAGSDLLVEALADGLAEPEPQVGEPTYAEKITTTDLHLDWTTSGSELSRVVRLGNAWTTFRDRRFKIWKVTRCDPETAAEFSRVPDAPVPGLIFHAHGRVLVSAGGGSWIELLEVQPEGKGRMDAGAWANGTRPKPGERFGAPS